MRRNSIVFALGLAGVLLVAALLAFRADRKPPPIDTPPPVHYFIARAEEDREVLRCDFSLALDRESAHDLWGLELQPCSLAGGWSNPKSNGVTAAANPAKLSFFVEGTDWTHVLLRVKATRHPTDDLVQPMTVHLNRQDLGSVELPAKWTTIDIEIPPGTLRRGVNNFSFSFADRAPLSRDGHTNSKPRYALNLREITLARSSSSRGAPLGAIRGGVRRTDDSSTRASTQIFDRDRDRFIVPGAGTLVLPMQLAATADRLEIEVTTPASQSDRGPRLTVSLRSLSTGASHTRSFETWVRRENGVFRGDVFIRDLAGTTCLISLDVEPVPGDGPLEIAPPRVIARLTDVIDRVEPDAKPQSIGVRPDIVLITLDAARPDHFSCYGYDRPTTPNIDRLAKDSLVFTNVFALVPNTRRSVPTMITGLSFLDHQVAGGDSALSGEAITLAEYLREAGYKTACFTASPNNSRAIGDDQGYDEFFELWTEVPEERSIDPHYLSSRVREWLAANDDPRPLHLQLHFVPPHAPYDPAPEFNLFTDPAYEGPVDGWPKTILRIDKGIRSVAEADLAQMIALYDGNLRAADDAVAEVLEALQTRGRWDNTVVLVTADHGEAFLEHRRMGHNSTVYDEMLRVPFILRVPGGPQDEGLDLDRLLTLADIVPTLLATASVPPSTVLDGVNVVEDARCGRRPCDRSFVGQTAHRTPTRCLRTPRFKVILANSGQGELYDLENDPGESHNLRFAELPLFVGLAQLLTQRLMVPPSLTRTRSETDAPIADQEMLEALGYLE